MEITHVFYPQNREELRQWFEDNRNTYTELWICVYNKASGKPSIAYDDLVEECLCFGWIDGIVKKYDQDSIVRRITPRRKKSFLSELNRQRVWKLDRLGLMTPDGIAPIADQIGNPTDTWTIPDWIRQEIQANPMIWATFQSFPDHYQRLKIGWITEAGKLRMEEQRKRLRYLIEMTSKGKVYGTIPEID
jgi:uncharacterized protein YdeI (YjbR/CyaY-like superfamily)